MMTSLLQLPSLAYVGLGLAGLVLLGVGYLFILPLSSSLNNIPGPGSSNIIAGNFADIGEQEHVGEIEREWVKKYGHVFLFKGFLGENRVNISDVRAIQHVFTNHFIYEKPSPLRYMLSRMLGTGLLVAEGIDHKNQRRIMNPSFSTNHIREMTEIFVAKSAELRDCLLDQIHTSPADAAPPGTARVEILSWLSRTTLDIIGLTGFNYSFDALKFGEESNELGAAFFEMFKSTIRPSALSILRAKFSFLRWIKWDRESRNHNAAQRTMRRIGMDLVREKQHAVRVEKASAGGTSIEKSKDRDLLSLMIRANMDPDVPADQQLTVEQILNQIPTFLVAGHETTSTSTTWTLYALSRHPEIQRKLRAELRAFPHDAPTMDDLNAFPYLEAVVRETLRLHPAVEATDRVATKEDVIPLAKPFTDRHGILRHEVRISKGDIVIVPIHLMNTSLEIWGSDALEFKPERWFAEIPGGNVIPGVWGNVLSFISGARSCIGFRFALVEMKALLFHLIRSFEFELPVPVEDIGSKWMVVVRPYLKSELEKGNQLPLIIRPVDA